MLLDVRVKFNQAVEDILPPDFRNREEVIKYLLSHERKDVALNNLCQQIMIAEKSHSVKLTGKKLDMLVNNFARMFVKAAIEQRIQTNMSSAEKARRVSGESKYEEIQSCIKEVNDEPGEGEDNSGAGGDFRS